MADTQPQPNHVSSQYVIITVNVTNGKIDEVQYVDSQGNRKHLPKIGEAHPGNGKPIMKEPGTDSAAAFAQLKWHHHNPDCITIDIGGAQYQVCWP